ncbi:MAG TPA: DUF3299 domain-containing protein [Burkholderiales bacterium]|nr:DUF3299 domain-containing protein [Burkholderiales bacterium]
MRLSTLLIALALAVAGVAALPAEPPKHRVGDRLKQSKGGAKSGHNYQEIGWNALIPTGWDPAAPFRNMNLGVLSDADVRANNALELMRKAWDEAPVEAGWNGQRVRIPGFVVPLERRDERVTEFLLVPYFGACIHVPPPPANQIIDVFPNEPVPNMRTMDAVWVIGPIEARRSEPKTSSDRRMGMGTAGYRMKAELIEPYKDR